jgi:hypothetical protein
MVMIPGATKWEWFLAVLISLVVVTGIASSWSRIIRLLRAFRSRKKLCGDIV